MDARSRLVRAFNDYGGRVSSEQILKFIKEDELLKQEPRYSVKKLIASIAVVEYDLDKMRYLVLKDLVRDKENLTSNKMCQSTQTTTTSQPSDNQNIPKSILSSQESQSIKSPVPNRSAPPQLVPDTATTIPTSDASDATVRPPVYSTFTSNETRLWWMAVIDCRLADMKRLLGLNPKLASWADPVNGWTALHYAAKFGNINCLKLLINQYHANVNTRSRNGRTPLHIAVVHSQRIIIRALIDDFKADPSLMDFSGYFPYMLLEDNLKAEYEPLLTYGRLQRIRTALKVFKSPANNTHDSSSSTSAKDYSSFNKKPIQHLDHSMNDFKQPTVLYRRLENFKRPQPNCFNRTSTLKPIHQNGEHNCLRRASVFENILKSAADAAQNWNHHSSTGKLSTESNEEQIKNNDKVNNTDKPSNSSSSSSSTASSATTTTTTTVTTDPHTRLVQRLDSMISLRRRDQQNTLSNFTNTNHTTTTTTSSSSNDIGSSYDSSTSLDHEDVHGHHYRKVNTLLDHRFGFSLGGNHNSKHLPQSTDPYTLKLLLSLLPPPPPTSSTSSSSSTSCLKRVDSHNDHDDDIKSKKHHTSFSSFHKHLNKKLHRSLSNSSSTATSSLSLSSASTRTHIKPSSFKYNHSNNTRNNNNSTINTNGTLHEFHSLPHRIHSSTTNEFDNDHVINHDAYHSPHLKSLSTTALLAETDVRQLFTNKLTTIIKRKSSTISQHSNLS